MTLRTSRGALTGFAAALISAVLLTGCATSDSAETTPSAASSSVDVLAAHGLDGLDGRALVDRLEATPVADRADDFIASVRADSVVIIDGTGTETPIALPEREFYLSFAPYVSQTHDCYYHSLTTCLGEQRNVDAHVTVTTADGDTLVNSVHTTNDNGFIGLWLPRGIEATLTVTIDGRTATGAIETGADDPTCLTTLQLA